MTLSDFPATRRVVGSFMTAGSPSPDSDGYDRSAWLAIERTLCLATLFLLGWYRQFHLGLTFGTLAALVLCPIWLRVLPKYRFAGLLFICGGLTYLSGLGLALFAKQQHRYVSVHSILSATGLWLGIFLAVGLLLWVRTILSLGPIGTAYGLGMLLHQFTNPYDPVGNPWKFVYSMPITIIALSLASRRGNRGATLIVLLILAGVSAALDSRSLFGELLMAAILIAWQLRPQSRSKPLAWGWTLGLICGLSLAIYNLATSLMLGGYLGADAQQRTRLQVDSAGSLILGGRPELAATIALIGHSALGFGLGVAPNIFDVMTAKSGMMKINYDPNNGYVDNFMFGGQVELHSIIGDLWATFGLPGIAMAVVIALLAIRSVSRSMSGRDGNGLLIVLVCSTLWNLLFSPLYGSLPTLVLMLGVMLAQERSPTANNAKLAARPPRTRVRHGPLPGQVVVRGRFTDFGERGLRRG